MADDLPLLFDRIRDLLAEASDASRPLLGELERTLTDGYAHALALEGERWRIEKRIGELARKIQEDPRQARELRRLSTRLSSAEGDLARLRALLGVLRERTEVARSGDVDPALGTLER